MLVYVKSTGARADMSGDAVIGMLTASDNCAPSSPIIQVARPWKRAVILGFIVRHDAIVFLWYRPTLIV